MKKVFALVLAVVLVLAMGTVAMADTTLYNDINASGTSGIVNVGYSVTNTVAITVSYSTLDSFAFTWNGTNKAWVADKPSVTSTFTITNNGSIDKDVTLAVTGGTNGTYIDTAEFSTTAAQTVQSASTNSGTAGTQTNTLTVTPKTLTGTHVDATGATAALTISATIG